MVTGTVYRHHLALRSKMPSKAEKLHYLLGSKL
jgi:hypothetical protein